MPILVLCVVAGLLFLAGWGLTLIYTGLRGVPSLCAPACAKCGYDLRGFTGEPPTACSECGANLTRPGTVRLARLQRQPWRAVRGVVVIAVVLVVLVSPRWFAATRSAGWAPAGSPAAIAAQTNAQVIAGLSTTANTPWGWQELDRRLAAGTLPPADVTAAIDQYIKFRSTAGPNRTAGPLEWCDGFMKRAQGAGLIPPAQFDRLADAYFGPQPVVTIAPRVTAGAVTPVTVEYGGPWDLLDYTVVYALRSVTLEDGSTVETRSQYNQWDNAKANAKALSGRGPFDVNAELRLACAPGPHTLAFTVDTGLVPPDMRQLMSQSQPGPADRWPTNVPRTVRVVKVPVTVTAPGAATVERVTDTAHHPWPPFTLKAVMALPADDGTTVKVELDAAASDVDCAYDVILTVNGHREDLGVEDRKGNTGSSSEHTVVEQPSLPPGVTTATVTLVPNIQRAAKTAGVSRVWDIPLEFKDVPLRRLDVPQP
jgi:hypothetical protein